MNNVNFYLQWYHGIWAVKKIIYHARVMSGKLIVENINFETTKLYIVDPLCGKFIWAVVSLHRGPVIRHVDVMAWKCFLHYWPFVRGIHWAPVDESICHRWILPKNGQWCRALKFTLLSSSKSCWTNNWVTSRLLLDSPHKPVMWSSDIFCAVSF